MIIDSSFKWLFSRKWKSGVALIAILIMTGISEMMFGLMGPVFIWSPVPPSTRIVSIIYVPRSEIGSLAFFFQIAVDITIIPLSWICLATMIMYWKIVGVTGLCHVMVNWTSVGFGTKQDNGGRRLGLWETMFYRPRNDSKVYQLNNCHFHFPSHSFTRKPRPNPICMLCVYTQTTQTR